jgi:hypothetical protein
MRLFGRWTQEDNINTDLEEVMYMEVAKIHLLRLDTSKYGNEFFGSIRH